MLKLSKASKMPCLSWSLQAGTPTDGGVCAGAVDKHGDYVDACKGCYARSGNYRFPNVRKPRDHNKTDWQRDDWVNDMVAALAKESYFRWFDSGDMYSLGLARKILDVMLNTPHVKHWLPTRMHKFAKFRRVIAQMESLANVVVRLSSDSIVGETIKGKTTSTIIPHADFETNATVCGAYSRDGKCGDCRACWDKNIAVVAYPAHGKQMIKLVELAA